MLLDFSSDATPVDEPAVADQRLDFSEFATANDNIDETEESNIVSGESAVQNRFAEELARRGTQPGAVEDGAKGFLTGFNEGIGRLIDLPTTLPTAVIGMIPGSEHLGFPQNLEELEEHRQEFGVGANLMRSFSDYEPETASGRVAQSSGRELATSLPLALIPMAGAAAPVARGVSAIPKGTLDAVGKSAVAAARAAPATTLAAETISAAAAGAGGGIADEIDPGDASSRMLGEVAGGLAPAAIALSPSVAATRFGRAVMNRFSSSAQTQAARREVSEALGGQLTPAARENLENAERVGAQIEGFQPSLAEATDAPSIVQTQRDVEKGASGADLEAFRARRDQNQDAIDSFASERAPDGIDNPEFIFDGASGRLKNARGALEKQTADVTERAERLADSLPVADRSAVGDQLRDRLTTLQRAEAQRMADLADELGLNNDDSLISFDAVRQQLNEDEAFQLRGKFSSEASRPEVLDEVLKTEGDVTFQDWMSLRQRVSEDLRDAQRSANPNAGKIRQLAILDQRLDELTDEALDTASESAPHLAENYARFRETYRTEYIERFRRGATFEVKRRDGGGFYRTRDENVASAFFKAGDIGAARQFRSTFGDNPEATAALESVALDSLRDAAVRDGQINPKLYDQWYRRHRPVLEEYPSIKGRVDDVGGALASIVRRQDQLRSRAATVDDMALSRVIDRVTNGQKTPERAVQDALKDNRLLKSLMRSVRGDSAALGALRRHVWDSTISLTPKDQRKFLDANAAAINRVFGNGSHVRNLRTVLEAREMLARVPDPSGVGVNPDPLKNIGDALGQSPKQIASRAFAVRSGRTSARIEAIDVLGRFLQGRRRAVSEDLWRQALYDPQVAKDLAAVVHQGELSPVIEQRLRAYLLNAGSGLNLGQESELIEDSKQDTSMPGTLREWLEDDGRPANR
ncbi:hypothetical protein QMT40_001775 [Parvibaculaceae bacterium PLY_AMNH_Bact1]|nr:hypothetical protein QMT40_001775 [Parvibaculaceae bacterium PLY_AMNH_Bact1]